jgi:hypothetical protein
VNILKYTVLAAALTVSTHAAGDELPANVEAFAGTIYIAKPSGKHELPTISMSQYEWDLLIEDLMGRKFDTSCEFNGFDGNFDGNEVRCIKAGPYRAVLGKDFSLNLFKEVDTDMIKLAYNVDGRYRVRHLIDFDDVRAAFELPAYPPVHKSGS